MQKSDIQNLSNWRSLRGKNNCFGFFNWKIDKSRLPCTSSTWSSHTYDEVRSFHLNSQNGLGGISEVLNQYYEDANGTWGLFPWDCDRRRKENSHSVRSRSHGRIRIHNREGLVSTTRWNFLEHHSVTRQEVWSCHSHGNGSWWSCWVLHRCQ